MTAEQDQAGRSATDERLYFRQLLSGRDFAVSDQVAAQMVNFPVAAGTTGHLLGGALAAVLLGPYLATLVVATVVVVQALIFADGARVPGAIGAKDVEKRLAEAAQ